MTPLPTTIAAIVIAYAMAPKAPQQPPPSIDDIQTPTAEEGKEIAVVFGEVYCRDPNVVWYGDLATQPIKKKGGKK